MSSYDYVDVLLSRFDEIQELVEIRKRKVERFLRKLEGQLNWIYLNEHILDGCHFTVVGSAAEETAVRDCVDFDVIMTLPQPFTMDTLVVRDVSKDGVMGVYKLQKYQRFYDENGGSSYEYDSNSSSSGEMMLDAYTNKNGYLKVKQLKNALFDELEFAVNEIAIETPDVNYVLKGKNSSFCVTIQPKYSPTFKIDLIPQIKASQLDFSQDWDNSVPYVVEDYLYNYTEHTHFNLSFPFWLDEESYEHLAVYATFSQLEGHCMRASDHVRNAVRLTKAVSKHYGWVEMGLQSFHIKRTAIALFDTLDEMDPWNGFQTILSELKSQLQNGVIWGVFLRNHDIALKDANTCLQLAHEINLAKKNICPTNILEKLSEYV